MLRTTTYGRSRQHGGADERREAHAAALEREHLTRDAGAGEAGHGLGGLIQRADDAGAALAGARELDGSADLGLHGALAELTLVGEFLGLVGGELLELLLVGLAKVDGHVLDGGQQEQNVGGAVLSKQLATHVLVNNRGDALVAALVLVVANHGDAAATAGDDDELVVEQVQDGIGLDDLLGLRGGHDAAPTTAGVLDEGHLGVLGHDLAGLLLGVERADRLGGVRERGIIGVALDLGDDGGGVPALVTLVHLAADALLQVVANVALGHGAALGQIHGRGADGVVRRGEGVLNHADLRAVAVGDDDLVALLDEAQKGVSGVVDLLDLLGRGVAQGVAAEGNDDAVGLAVRLGHVYLISSKGLIIHQLFHFMQYTPTARSWVERIASSRVNGWFLGMSVKSQGCRHRLYLG